MISAEELCELVGPKGPLSPEEQARLIQEQIEGQEFFLKKLAQKRPELLEVLLRVLEPEQRLEGLTPEQRQQLLKLLSSQSDQNQE